MKKENNEEGMELTLSDKAHDFIAKYGACSTGYMLFKSEELEKEYDEAFLNLSIYMALLEKIATIVNEEGAEILDDIAEAVEKIRTESERRMRKGDE